MCTSKPPSAPTPPPPPPKMQDPAVKNARERELQKARLAAGRGSTILTGSSGVSGQAGTTKTLLGQ